MHVYVNTRANYGKALSAWQRIEPQLRERFGYFEAEEVASAGDLKTRMSAALAKGERRFVAAGGDGTVNLVADALITSSAASGAILGAVGLGSSNDFHKPFRKESMIIGIPTRLDWDHPTSCDAIAVLYLNGGSEPSRRHCLINASVGVTAEANALHNAGSLPIKFLQRLSVEAAILASALRALVAFRDLACELAVEGGELRPFQISNLAVLKNPHLAGRLRYRTPVAPDDGSMRVNLCVGMSRPEVLATMIGLYRGRFRRHPKFRSWRATGLCVSARRPFSLELDGEVVCTHHAEFRVKPRAVRCCS